MALGPFQKQHLPTSSPYIHLDTPYKSSEVGAASISQDVGHCDLECLCCAPAPGHHHRLQNTEAPELSLREDRVPLPSPPVPICPEWVDWTGGLTDFQDLSSALRLRPLEALEASQDRNSGKGM